jgi:hypothetical protein
MQGRPPKPGARQPNRGLGGPALVKLPRSGRQGEPLDWPLDRPSRRELTLWARLWQTPQAVAWEALDWADVVARYARVLTVAEKRGAPYPAMAEARQLEDRLGLTPMSLLKLRWSIVDEQASEQPELEVVDIRERLRAVE